MNIVWFSEIKWSYLRTRKQQIIRRFPPDWKVLFIEPVVKGARNRYWPRRDGSVTYATVPFFKGTPYAIVNRLQCSRLGQFLFHAMAYLWIGLLLRMTGFASADRVVCTSNVYYIRIICRLRRRFLVYDCNDYPLGFKARLPIVDRYFWETAKEADVVTTVSTRLADELRKVRTEGIVVIGNGVDTSLFSNSAIRPGDFPPASKPVIFFSGAVSEWFDVELLQRIHREIPQASLVIVGPHKDAATSQALHAFAREGRVFLVDAKPHDELPKYVAQADVCIFPAKFNERSFGANPNTIYEFMAAGKPVVTMSLSDELRALSHVIRVADSADEFVAMVKEALACSHDADRTRSEAQRHDWKHRADQFVALLQTRMT